MRKKQVNNLIVILSVISTILFIYIGSTLFGKVKIDVTSDHLYSLSQGSKDLLAKLNSPISLKLYYSKTAAMKGSEGIRTFNNYFEYVKKLLEEFVSHSGNRLQLEVIDPRPDTDEEEDAMRFGLKKFHLTETETYFFGLVAISDSKTEKVIEFFDPAAQEKLEYSIAKLIYSVTNFKRYSVGILSTLDIYNENLNPYIAQIMRMQGKTDGQNWFITEMLKEFYDLKMISKDANEIPKVDLLWIVHPKGLEQKTLFAIDQYLLEGGKIVLMLDPKVAALEQGMGQGNVGPSDLGALLSAWNINFHPDKFAGDKYLAGVGQVHPSMPPQRLLPILRCTKECSTDYKDVISSSLNDLVFVFPGVLEIANKDFRKNIKIAPFLSTSKKGNSYSANQGDFSFMLENFRDGSSPVVLGYKLTGHFDSAFPSGLIIESEKNKKKEQKTGHKESQKDGAVIIFADIDFISNQFAFRNNLFGLSLANDNASLLLNAFDNLVGSVDLMNIRSKEKFSRNFTIVDKIEFDAAEKTKDKVMQINSNIELANNELKKLGQAAQEGANIAILKNEELKKKKELSKKIAALKKELREAKREGREKVESLGRFLQYFNTLFVPLLLIGFGIFFNWRKQK